MPPNMGNGVNTNYTAPNPLLTKQKSPLNPLLIPLVTSVVFLVIAMGFGMWAFAERQDYKNNVDTKVETARELATQEAETRKDKEFVEKEKIPHRSYKSPDTLAGVQFEYPKTWSAFITEDDNTNSGTPLDGFLHPDFVPAAKSGTDFALRVQVESRPYSDMLSQYEGKVKQGKVKISPYKAPKVPTVLGVRIEGEINKNQNDTMILLPIRDKTLILWTESNQFKNDLDKIILASLTFVP